jgi:hypothetical protein
MVDEKAKKACIKEGGKKAIDLVGVSDMGEHGDRRYFLGCIYVMSDARRC